MKYAKAASILLIYALLFWACAGGKNKFRTSAPTIGEVIGIYTRLKGAGPDTMWVMHNRFIFRAADRAMRPDSIFRYHNRNGYIQQSLLFYSGQGNAGYAKIVLTGVSMQLIPGDSLGRLDALDSVLGVGTMMHEEGRLLMHISWRGQKGTSIYQKSTDKWVDSLEDARSLH